MSKGPERGKYSFAKATEHKGKFIDILGRSMPFYAVCEVKRRNLSSRIEYIVMIKDYERARTALAVQCDKQEKGVWGMPRLPEAMKDVISCEKPRGTAHEC